MIGTVIGQMAVAVRFTTTTMFTCLIRRSHQHAATATILQDLQLQTVRGESAGLAVSAGPVVSAGLVVSAGQVVSAGPAVSGGPVISARPVVSAALVESVGPGQSVNRGELAGQAASGVQEELAGVLDQTLPAERVPPAG